MTCLAHNVNIYNQGVKTLSQLSLKLAKFTGASREKRHKGEELHEVASEEVGVRLPFTLESHSGPARSQRGGGCNHLRHSCQASPTSGLFPEPIPF